MALSTRNVQTTFSTSDASGAHTRTVSYTVGSGTELLVVIARLSAGEVSAANVSAVRWADSSGASDEALSQKVERISPGALGTRVEIWYLPNPTARAGLIECDYTVTTSGIRSTSWTILEVIGGVDTAAPVGVHTSSNGTAAAAPLTLTSTVDGALILSSAAHIDVDNDPYTPSAGITAELADGQSGTLTTDHSYWAGECLTTTAGAYAVGATGSGASKNFAVAAMEVLPVAAGGGDQTLTPSLFTNSNTFYAPTVSGTYTLSPGLYTDSDTFYSPTVSTSYSITPGLYTDPDTFYSPTVSATYTLTPGLYDDGDTFYTHVVSLGGSQTLVPGLYVDSDTFYSPTVSSTYTLTPALYADPDTFYSATINSTYVISPALYVDADTFYAATVGASGGPQTLLPSLYVDPDTFYVHTVTGGLGSGVGQRTRYITAEFYDSGDVWRTNIARDILEYSAQPSKIAFSYMSPQDTIAYSPSTDKIHYTRGQVMGSIQRRSAFKKVFVAPPPPPNPILWSSDGSSLVGWTVVGATVDASLGDPAPSLQATGGQYAYIAPVAGLVGKSILARVWVIAGGTALCSLWFGCNASGAGPALRFEARAGQNSGIETHTTWAGTEAPAATGIVVPAGVWLSARIDIKAGPVVDWYLDNVLKQSNVPITINGDHIAVHGYSAGVTGGNFDNLQIATTSLL